MSLMDNRNHVSPQGSEVQAATSHLVSFCNPNYELSDHLNSNVIFEEGSVDNGSILEEFKHKFYDNDKDSEVAQNRKKYGELDLTAMGVATTPKASPNSSVVMRVKKQNALPAGWEQHSDADGFYFWHVASGTIQREPPTNNDATAGVTEENVDDEESRLLGHLRKSCTVDSIAELLSSASRLPKRQSLPPMEQHEEVLHSKVAVRSLGWLELSDAELASAELSSKSVNKCILQLANNASIEGQRMWLQLDETALKLLHDANEPSVVIQQQPIHAIRVWGVGRDNRDFAYVARDRFTGKHLCHVFRCEHVSARLLANALRDMCKRILIDRGSNNISKSSFARSNEGSRKSKGARPNSLLASSNSGSMKEESHKSNKSVISRLSATEGFPTPLEEPKKILEAEYVGSIGVNEASGMRVLRSAITELVSSSDGVWPKVKVHVAPSTICVAENEQILMECRVRFLSFLGIGQDSRKCAFIVHTAQDTFVAHVFHCESSAGDLCRAIEAACKLRYQKCLDARPNECRMAINEEGSNEGYARYTANLGKALKRFVLRNVAGDNS